MRRIASSILLCSLLAMLLVSTPHARNTPWEDEPPTEVKEQPWGGDNQGGGGNADDVPTITVPKQKGKPIWIRVFVSIMLELGTNNLGRPDSSLSTEKEQF